MTGKLDKLLEFLKEAEDCKLKAYKDIAGVWTIGYGHTEGVREGDTCTQEQAEAWLLKEASWRYDWVSRRCKVPATHNQMCAMTSLVYNIGIGGFRSSSVLRFHNLGKHEEAANAFLLFNKARHPVTRELRAVSGLTIRREKEKKIYLTPDEGTSHV